jgi:hypothetical protein
VAKCANYDASVYLDSRAKRISRTLSTGASAVADGSAVAAAASPVVSTPKKKKQAPASASSSSRPATTTDEIVEDASLQPPAPPCLAAVRAICAAAALLGAPSSADAAAAAGGSDLISAGTVSLSFDEILHIRQLIEKFEELFTHAAELDAAAKKERAALAATMKRFNALTKKFNEQSEKLKVATAAAQKVPAVSILKRKNAGPPCKSSDPPSPSLPPPMHAVGARV